MKNKKGMLIGLVFLLAALIIGLTVLSLNVEALEMMVTSIGLVICIYCFGEALKVLFGKTNTEHEYY